MSIYANNEYYHIYNRGVGNYKIFKTDEDRKFFLKRMKDFEIGRSGKKEVTVAAYCLMGSHYHLLIRQECDSGISRYMQRFGTSYMMRWNRLYDWSGRLFEGPFKSRHIHDDAYLAHAIRYIHMNPLGNRAHTAKEEGRLDEAIEYLVNYPWSDCRDYDAGKGVLSSLFHPMLYREFLAQWMRWPLNHSMLGMS